MAGFAARGAGAAPGLVAQGAVVLELGVILKLAFGGGGDAAALRCQGAGTEGDAAARVDNGGERQRHEERGAAADA